jgi:hypothetical protein
VSFQPTSAMASGGLWCQASGRCGIRPRSNAVRTRAGRLKWRRRVRYGHGAVDATVRTMCLFNRGGPSDDSARAERRARVTSATVDSNCSRGSRLRDPDGKADAGIEDPDRGATVGGGRRRLGRVTWHQFRHIHSTLLNDLKIPVKIVQEQLGHASIQTTLNIYTHVVDASHRKAIEAMERELFQVFPIRGSARGRLPVSDSIN